MNAYCLCYVEIRFGMFFKLDVAFKFIKCVSEYRYITALRWICVHLIKCAVRRSD